MRPTRLLLAIGFALALAACNDPPSPSSASSAIETLADEYLEAWMETDALMGTYYSIEGSRHDRLPDNSLAGLAAWQQKEDAWLARFEAIEKPAEVGSRDWVTYGLLKEQLESSLALAGVSQRALASEHHHELAHLDALCFRHSAAGDPRRSERRPGAPRGHADLYRQRDRQPARGPAVGL